MDIRVRIASLATGMKNFASERPVSPVAMLLVWMLSMTLMQPVVVAAEAELEASPARTDIVPAARQANSVAIITIEGPIDRWTVLSVERRMKKAESIGADAIVFELNTPGGEVGAVLEICNAIKNSPIPNTVAWVRPDAYSGGAIIALACREIVVAEYATMGDALPVMASPITGLQALPAEERQKILAPLLAEVVDSARRRGYDEKLVQGFVMLGVELWLVEHVETGERLFVDEYEYELLVGETPERVRPTMASGATAGERFQSTVSDDSIAQLKEEVDANVSTPSARPVISGDQRGKWKLVEYATDGATPLTLKTAELERFGFSADTIRNDTELIEFFGGADSRRFDRTWSETLARFLSSLPVRGLLIVVLLLSLFLEMASPGLGVPGAIAGGALLALFAPAVMVNAAAWWALAAVVTGILLVLVEVLVIPGFGVFGIGGLIMLLGGLIGLLAGPDVLSPGEPGAGSRLAWATATIVLALFSSIGGMWLIARHMGSVPFMNRLVLTTQGDNGSGSSMLAAMGSAHPQIGVEIGDVGVAHTSLRPSGSAEFGDRLVDVVCEYGFIEAGSAVRVVSVTKYRVAVEPAESDGAQA